MSNVYVKIWPAGNVPDNEWEAFLSHLIEGVENASVNLRARHGIRLDSHPVIIGEKFAVFELCALKSSIVGTARHLRGISRYMLERNPSLKLYQCGSRLLFYDFMDHITKKPEVKRKTRKAQEMEDETIITAKTPIAYCPFCGRELRKAGDDE